MIIYNAAIYKNKLEVLHLGGGNLNNVEDNLFKFKKFTSTSNHKYYIGKRINNLEIYKKLKNAWKKNILFYTKTIQIDYFAIILILR